MPKRIFAVSDVHIGGLHLNHAFAKQAIAHGIAQCDEAVLVGDVFEARSRVLNERTRLRLCKEAMDEWAKANPRARIHILLGNHEKPIRDKADKGFAYCDEFTAALRDYARRYSNVIFHDEPHLQIGDALFIHGHYEVEHPKPRILDMVEGLAANFVSGYVAGLIKPREHFVVAITGYLHKKGLPGVKHVFFGHIHQRFLHHPTKDADSPQFHNFGTFQSISRKDANPVMITQDDNGHTVSVVRFL